MKLPDIRTMPVDSFEEGASPIGCLNMTGNVWEWCQDFWSEKFYETTRSREKNPVNRRNSFVRIIRGGSYNRSLVGSRGSRRQRWGAREHGDSFGFRCARTAR
jgi:formylglycine-generating enzyme required for sulfatase activity